MPEGSFWQDEKLAHRLGSRLDRWVSLMRMHGGSQAEMIESAGGDPRSVFKTGQADGSAIESPENRAERGKCR